MNKFVVFIVAVSLGFGAGIVLNKQVPSSENVSKAEPKVAYWVAPMDANYRRDKPGKSPMGMDLVPVYEDDVNGNVDETKSVRLSPSVVNNFGVRTAKVARGEFRSQIDTVGYVDYDESKIIHVHLRAEGWIEKLYINSVGERVKKGDLLFEVYSPTLVNAQSDYLNALSTGRRDIIKASKERLEALDISNDLIAEIKKTKSISQYIKVYAPQDGIVAELKVAEGMHVTPKLTIISLADLSSVWILVDVFETQVSQIKEGLSAEVKLSYEPGRVWTGKVAYIYPQIDPKTRTLKIRLVFDNEGEILKPNMYADVTIFGQEKPNTLSVPREAVIRTGDTDRVILALEGGKFQPAAVKIGIEAGRNIEILSGLDVGEKIVTSAQFLIDSEASFTGSTIRMKGTQKKTMPKKIEKKSQEKEVWGVGTLNTIMLDQGKLNVTHEPIAVLGWPGMTMDFLIADSVETASLKEGMEVHFKIRKTESGMYEITELMDMEDMQ